MNIQDWFPLGWTGWISLQSKELSSLVQHHSSKASILYFSAFFIFQLSHPYTTVVYTFLYSKDNLLFWGKVEVGLIIVLYRRLGISKSGSPQLWCKPTACSASTMAVSHCFNIYLFTYLRQELVAAHRIFSLHGSMWNLVPRPEMDPGSPALGARSLCPWTTREVPHIVSRWCGLRKERPLLEHKAHAACHDVSSLSLTQESDVFCRHVPKCDWVNMLHCKQGGKISDFSQFWTLQPLTL